jgi:hypothetical protein
MNLYDIESLIQEIEDKAESNGGELSEQDTEAIVQAKTQSIEKLNSLVKYMCYLDGFSDMADAEIEKLKAKKKSAQNRLESIKNFLKPYLHMHNGKVSAGAYTLSLRKSEGIVLADDFNNPMYCTTKTVTVPDKNKIKEEIKAGIEVRGAILEQRESVVIK